MPAAMHPGFNAGALTRTRHDQAVALDEFEPLANRHQANPAARTGTVRIEATTVTDDVQPNLGGGASQRHQTSRVEVASL